MAWRCGSLSRSLLSTARASSLRSSPPLPRLRPPLAAPRLQSRRLPFVNPRTMGELGCMQSFLSMHSMVTAACLTSHLAVDAHACYELSQVLERLSDFWSTY